jgi:AcrR family transcriptional regulator
MAGISTLGTREEQVRGSRRRPGRRDELLAAALDVIRRVGPGASMDEMAAESGITKPVLYRYFGDREGLITAVGERFSERLVTRLEAALADADQEPVVMIRAAVEAYVAFIEEDQALYGFLTNLVPLGGPAGVAVIGRIADSIAKVIGDVLAGLGLDDRPATTWAHGVVGMVHFTGARWARSPDIPRDRLVDDVVALVAYGLTGASASSRAGRRPSRG